jgi:hypothetical protein
MKPLSLILFSLLLSAFTFAQNASINEPNQNLTYELVGPKSKAIQIEQLNTAETLLDLNQGFPSNWISDYTSVSISTTIDGKENKAIGSDQSLNADQKNLLSQAQLGNEIIVDVKYKIKNATTQAFYDEKMSFHLTVVPQTQAQFVGGKSTLDQYMAENGMDFLKNKKIPISGSVKFTINEEGKIENPIISKTSGQQDIDNFLLDIVRKMPKWNPAKTNKNKTISQNFELILANQGC